MPVRIGPAIAATLTAHRAAAAIVNSELVKMRDCRFGPTASRGVVGVMNEFAHLARHDHRRSTPDVDMLRMSKNSRRRHAVRSTAATSVRTESSKPSLAEPGERL